MSMDDLPQKGGLFLSGNARDLARRDDSILAELVRGPGGAGAARVVLVWASGRGARCPDDLAAAFERLGVVDFRSLDLASRDDADRAHGVGLVERATAVVLDGESPSRVVQALRETKLDAALRRRLVDSAFVAGLGHGATAMAGRFLVDGVTDPDHGPDPEVTAPVTGLGYLPGAILDPFFARDGQPERLLTALIDSPDDLGLGLGDLSSIRLAGGRFEVLGKGAVAVIDASGAGKYVQHLLRPGDRFDLLTRSPI